VNSTRLGLVGDFYTVSPSGSGRYSFQNSAATIYTIASTRAMLLCRAETRQRRYAALAVEPCCRGDFNLHQAAWHSSRFLHTQFLSYTTTPTGGPCSFLPERFWSVSTTKVYSGIGAGVVMESISLFYHQQKHFPLGRRV